jgi:hypothetical protein
MYRTLGKFFDNLALVEVKLRWPRPVSTQLIKVANYFWNKEERANEPSCNCHSSYYDEDLNRVIHYAECEVIQRQLGLY